ncbi:hypothetical protein AVEN_186171-1 [Araneus ventricosus]|uniref:Uncharacterized protein n=1 Tax=Araneus ventricosus TaxID=182803 RepID=A0A4Y2GE53_ARAVE|nr:hypothetical protein AVEN_186171-1 [Araneus ventricosus]
MVKEHLLLLRHEMLLIVWPVGQYQFSVFCLPPLVSRFLFFFSTSGGAAPTSVVPHQVVSISPITSIGKRAQKRVISAPSEWRHLYIPALHRWNMRLQYVLIVTLGPACETILSWTQLRVGRPTLLSL